MDDTTFVVIDSEYQVRNSLARVLSQKGYVVQVDCAAEFGRSEFDDAIVFVSDRQADAVTACDQLQNAGIFFPVIAYSASPSLAQVMDRIHGSCAGYVEWPGDEAELWNTLKVVTDTAATMIRRRTSEARARLLMSRLTPRERQVAAGIGAGLSSKELAIPLGISFRTVELHRANIIAKLEATNLASLMRIIIEAGDMQEPGQAEYADDMLQQRQVA
ncbi:response regulator transcription factor [Qipengyuania sp. MTN3-11]|uniref:response regulator transcription factor n=1 Tax=Qipengyuania sp. MTN3-11 TaxID=3056557 RepID=UPI0036F3CB8E